MTLTRWRKSSYSGNQGDCVEIAHTLDAVRDSKNPDTVIVFRGLPEFLRQLKEGTTGANK